MTTTTTATRTTRTEAALPAGPAWEFFAARHPEVDQARIARRWHDATQLYFSRSISEPDADGNRMVLAQGWNDPNRPQEDPTSYTVSIAIHSPRTYACSCPDWTYRMGYAGFCKHILAVWQTLYHCCERKQMERMAEELVAGLSWTEEDRQEFVSLMRAIACHDGKAARTSAARLAGWPSRKRNRRRKEVSAHNTEAQRIAA